MTATASEPSERRRRRRLPLRRISAEHRRATAVLGAAVIAPLAGTEPTGSTVLDVLWCSAIAAVVAYFATSSKRGPLLVAVTASVISSRSLLAVAFALGAVAMAALSTRHLRRRATFARGAAGGLAAISALESSMHRPGPYSLVALLVVFLPIVVSGFRNARPEVRKVAGWGFAASGVFVLLAGAAAGIGVFEARNKLDAGTVALELGLSAARQGDVQGAEIYLQQAEVLLGSARKGIDRWGIPALVVPGVSQHVTAVTAVLRDVERVAGMAAFTAGVADDEELTLRTGQVNLELIAGLRNPLGRLANALGEVVDEVDDRSGGALLPPLHDRLDRLRREASQAQVEARNSAEAARIVPNLLGREGPKRYLVLFTSPAEARGRFGFPGSFAEITFDDGRYTLGEHGTTSATFQNLQVQQAAIDQNDDQVRPYLAYGVTRLLLNVTVPPDFPTVARLAAEQWAQSGRAPVDGVMRFDPAALAVLIGSTGPISVPGVPAPLTPENLEQFLVFDQYVQFANENAPRREVLETVSEVTFERLETGTLPAPRQIVNGYGPLVDQGHLQVVSFDREGEDFLDGIDLTGRFRAPSSDSLLVTSVNSVGNKIDSFLTRQVRYEGAVADGRLSGRVTVTLANAAPAEDLPFYVIGSSTRPPLPGGTNRTSLLVYTSVPVTGVTVDGQPVLVRSEPTAGRWVHQLLVELPPGQARTVELALEGEVGDDPYALTLEPGLGTTADDYDVRIERDGAEPATFSGRVTTAIRVG